MKFYSEKLEALFDTEEQLKEAEAENENKYAEIMAATDHANKCLDKCLTSIEEFQASLEALWKLDEDAAIDFSVDSISKITKVFRTMPF